ncbi:MAG: enoyl-CoA hydratase/isomerase family protein [Planctomycetota bacterium]
MTVRHELNGDVGVLTLARPEKRNALTPEMLIQFTEGVGSLIDRGARVLLVTGEGRVFCSGFDLALCIADPGGDTMRSLLTGLDTAIRVMREAPTPVVLAAHGAAIAGGCAMLGGADVVVSDEQAKLGYPVVRIGVSPAVSAPFLTAQGGPAAARSRMLDPGLTTGRGAFASGWVQELVATETDVLPRASEIANELATKPSWAITATKALLNDLTTPPHGGSGLAASLALTGGSEERELLARAMAPKDHNP